MKFFLLCGQQCPLQAGYCCNGPSWIWRWRTSAWQCRMPAASAEWNPTGQRWGIFWTWNVKTFAFERHYHWHLTFKLHFLGSLFKSHRVEESWPERWSIPGILNVCGTKARLVQSQTRGSEGKKMIYKMTLSSCFIDSLSLTVFCFILKVLSELFSSVFENEEMPTPLHPLQGGLTDRLIKPTALLRSLSPPTQRSGSSSQVCATEKKNSLFGWRSSQHSNNHAITSSKLKSNLSYFFHTLFLSRTQSSV